MFERIRKSLGAFRTEWRANTVNPLHPKDPGLVEILNLGKGTSSGQNVTEDTARNYLAFYACVKVLSEDIAALPLSLMRRTDAGKEKARDQRLFDVIHNAPNTEITSYEFRQCLQAHLMIRGNAFAEIVRNNGGDVVELWPLRPDFVRASRADDGNIEFEVTNPKTGERDTLKRNQVAHLRGLTNNGLWGESPVAQLREAIGRGMAAQEYSARFFANDSTPGGVLQHPQTLSEPAQERLRRNWEQRHGLSNSHRIAILEEGLRWERIGLSAEDSQLLETEKFSRSQIAGACRVPAHKINDLDRATFNNIEEMSLEYILSILPWIVNWEQRLASDLLLQSERQGGLFFKHNLNALLRAKVQDRGEWYAKGRQWGWFSINDILELEDMNGIGPEGDERITPLNMQPAGATPPEEPDARFRILNPNDVPGYANGANGNG